MASYLSYFTSNNNASSAPPSSHGGTPQPSGSTWSSTFSSRIATLRKALTKDSEDDDPDNEDCSHISNVLRAYYTEKQRALPEWLPPDPKRPIAPPPQPQGSYGQYGNAYGAGYGAQNTHTRGPSGGRGGGLSDLWDPAPAVSAPPPQSLRAARPTPQSLRSNDSLRSQSQSQSGSSGQTTAYGATLGAARPLPSQRAGSYQTVNPVANQAGGLGSRDRLRARLQGGGSGRSSPSAGLNSGGSSGSQQPYGGPGGNYGTQNRAGSSQPFVSASEPWATSDPYSYSGNYDDGGLSNTNQYGNQGQRQRPGGPR